MQKDLTYGNVRDAVLAAFPDLLDSTWNEFGRHYDLEKGLPEELRGPYLIFEDVVQKLLFDLIETGRDDVLLARFFVFFEDMANSADGEVSNLLRVAILENLVYRSKALRYAWKFMGPKTREFAVWEANEQDRVGNLPPEYAKDVPNR
jgi:hypothetical protein